MRRPVLAVLCVSAIVTMLGARQNSRSVGTWKNFTDMKSVRALGANAGVLWAATGGGTFSYEMTNSGFRKFTNSDGLSSNELTAVTLDQAGRVWVGASDGSMNILDGGWKEILDIKISNRIQKSIRGFLQRGDSMFVVSDFGISVYWISREQFADTYANFGFPSQALVSSAMFLGNAIWVGTNQGVAKASLSSINLTSPTSWTRYGIAHGLPSTNITSLGIFKDTLLVGTLGGVAFFSGDTFQTMNALANRAIVDFQQDANLLYILCNSGNTFTIESMSHLTGGAQVVASHSGLQANDFMTFSMSSKFLVATSMRGVAQWNGSDWSYIVPNGPQSNLFVSVTVDHNGVLWAGSGTSGGKGFYRYDPSLPEGAQWKNFTNEQYPIMSSDDYYKVSMGIGGSVWVSSWGVGVVEVKSDTIRRRLHTMSTPSLATSDETNPNYPVIGSVAVDLDGTSWFVNRTAQNNNVLARLTNDTAFTYYRNLYNFSDGLFHNMVIDQFGTKWLGNAEPTSRGNTKGLYYFNENGIVSGTENTGGWGFMSTTDGLPNAVVLSFAVDHDGDVWIGTDLGVMIVTDPRFPRTRRATSFPLREQSIQAISVDGLNNKWIGTREGVFVVNPDGTQLLEQFTTLTTNGKLVSNDVRSIAIDRRRGLVYFGTERGLSSLQIAAVEPGKTYTSLELGPNPYLIPNEEQLVIRNLVINTTLKILTINGLLVSQFKAQGGGRAFWDGKDARGQFVPTGIYFVVAFADNGDQITTGKVAVVRR